jgi:hypothetical protein
MIKFFAVVSLVAGFVAFGGSVVLASGQPVASTVERFGTTVAVDVPAHAVEVQDTVIEPLTVVAHRSVHKVASAKKVAIRATTCYRRELAQAARVGETFLTCDTL